MTHKSFFFLITACTIALGSASMTNAEEVTVPIYRETAVVEGGDRAPLQIEETADEGGLQITLQYRENAYNSLKFTIDPPVDTEILNHLKFRVCFDSTDPQHHIFYVLLLSEGGRTYMTPFSRHAELMDDGSYEFSWDIINEPNKDEGADLNNISEMRFKFNFNFYDPEKPTIMTVHDIRFVSGESVRRGDPERFAAWREKMAEYRVSDSDSAHYLQPPMTGRLAKPVDLVGNGKALAAVVIAADASEPEKNAVAELRHWIQAITGADLAIVHEVPDPSQPAILIGSQFAAPHFSSDIDALEGTDGFAVRARGNHIHVFGAEPKGTMNGVFAFLENNTDIIWARPQPDYGTVFSKTANLSAVWGDAMEIPATEYRGWLPNLGGGNAFWLWSDRNRNNYVGGGDPPRQYEWGNRVEFGGGHNLHSFIPKDDPRYYPTIDGKKPETLSIWKHQICLSVPGLVDTFAGNVLTYINEKAPPGLDVFNIKIEDNWGVCECKDCMAALVLPDGTKVENDNPAFRSTQFYQFLNSVTAKINETMPDLKIQTYAYFYTAVPPLVELNPNIFVLFCPYVRPDHKTPLFSPINATWWQRLTDWAAATPNVLIREYYGILNEGRPLAEVVAADVQADLELGVRNFTAEITPDFFRVWSTGVLRGAEDEFDISAMEYWLINRIYWDPKADIESLRKYYLRRTFREAAPMMEKFFGTIRQGWFEELRPPSDWGNSQRMIQRTIIDKGKEDEMVALLNQAMETADHPHSRIMISKIQERFLSDLAKIHGEKKTLASTGPDPEVFFLQGWVSPNRNNPIYSTHAIVDGEVIPALRVTVSESPDRAHNPVFNANFPFGDVSGMTFRFTVIPANGGQLPDTMPLLSITDDQWKVETAAESDFSPSSTHPGAMEFRWTPEGTTKDGTPVDLKKVTRIQFFWPDLVLDENQSIELLLVDMTTQSDL